MDSSACKELSVLHSVRQGGGCHPKIRPLGTKDFGPRPLRHFPAPAGPTTWHSSMPFDQFVSEDYFDAEAWRAGRPAAENTDL
jgi:hypothetical protein